MGLPSFVIVRAVLGGLRSRPTDRR